MQKNKTTNQKKKIYTIAALLLACMLCSLMPQKVQAREYPNVSTLYVCGRTIIYAGQLEETMVSDGTGGTAVYDYDSNTLTLTNFHGKETANRTIIQANYMGDDFTICLKGNNSFETSYHATISIRNGSLCITGGGSLSLSEGIIGTMNKVTIKDCHLNIDATSYGIGDDEAELEIDDAVVDIKITQDGILNQYAGALDVKKLTVRSSNITTSVPAAGTQTQLGYYDPRAVFVTQEGGVVLSSDLSVTDEKGQLLYQRLFDGGSEVGKVYVYSPENGTEILTDENKIATCVNITSSIKTQKIQDQKKIDDVMALINAIGSVTENSAQQIEAARAAYEALSEELKSRITNYSTLQAAESTYQSIAAEKEDSKVKEESKIQEVIDLINSIGTVEEKSADQIEEARKAYDKLSAEQKKKVTNYKALKNAEASYKKVKNAKAKKVTIRNAVSKKKNRVLLTWKRDKTADGYQIAYSQNKKFKNQKTKTISKNKTVKYTIKKLKSKKTYYIKVRSYTKVNGKKVYGKWSKVRKVRVK